VSFWQNLCLFVLGYIENIINHVQTTLHSFIVQKLVKVGKIMFGFYTNKRELNAIKAKKMFLQHNYI